MTIAKSAQCESVLRVSEINNLVRSLSLNVDVRPALRIAGFCKPPGVDAVHLNQSIVLYRATQFVRSPRFENDPWQQQQQLLPWRKPGSHGSTSNNPARVRLAAPFSCLVVAMGPVHEILITSAHFRRGQL